MSASIFVFWASVSLPFLTASSSRAVIAVFSAALSPSTVLFCAFATSASDLPSSAADGAAPRSARGTSPRRRGRRAAKAELPGRRPGQARRDPPPGPRLPPSRPGPSSGTPFASRFLAASPCSLVSLPAATAASIRASAAPLIAASSLSRVTFSRPARSSRKAFCSAARSAGFVAESRTGRRRRRRPHRSRRGREAGRARDELAFGVDRHDSSGPRDRQRSVRTAARIAFASRPGR